MKSVAAKVTVVSSVPATAMAARVGASFTAAVLTCTCTAEADVVVPSCALIVNAFKVPLAWAAGVHPRLSPVPTNVVPAVTATPSLVSVPVLTASIRNRSASPSTSAASAAAARVA